MDVSNSYHIFLTCINFIYSFFAFTVVKAFTEIGVDHHIIRLVFNIVFFGVTLAIGGLAFSHGWHTIGSIF
jgi:hypothetical protein